MNNQILDDMKTGGALYNLLPAVYRRKDAENGFALSALTNVMEREMRLVKDDIQRLYDNWFVDTCQEWALPYIGELLGVRDIMDEKSIITSQRRRVANSVRYRRRRGIGAALEDIVYDVTGWHARVVEFFENVSITQSMTAAHPGKWLSVDFRDKPAMEQAGGPFDSSVHFADVRKPEDDKGKYNISNIGIFLWRLQSYRAFDRKARVCPGKNGGFFFSALGVDIPLFNKTRKNDDLTQMARARDLPVALSRYLFEKDLRDHKKLYAETPERHRPENSLYYGPEKALCIVFRGQNISPMKILSADLSDWSMDESKNGEVVAIDVELGRALFSQTFIKEKSVVPEDVGVGFHYGFSADMGGGSYNRISTMSDFSSHEFAVRVSKTRGKADCVETLARALALWEEACEQNGPGLKGVIRIADNEVYQEDIEINLPDNARLAIESEDGKNPFVKMSEKLQVNGPGEKEANLVINGVLFDRPIFVAGCASLKIAHCSVIPFEDGKLSAAAAINCHEARDVNVDISDCVTGALFLPGEKVASLSISDSIIDGKSNGHGIFGGDNAWGPSSVISRATLFGDVRVRELAASETIFSGVVMAERRQTGYVRFSYMAPGSKVPMKYRSQPDSGESHPIKPNFTSVKYGDPAYGQLGRICSKVVRKGAEDGSEMGAFKRLRAARREKNLKSVIRDHVRSDMTAGVFYAT